MTGPQCYGRSDAELAVLPVGAAPGAFAGQVVVISGAGTGIGRASAHWFARLGADVVLCGRNADRLAEAGAAVAAHGGRVMVEAMTIRDPDAVAALFDRVWREWGRVDVLVNNAGGQFPQAAIDFSAKGWNAVIDTNLNGPWWMMQAAARHWRDAGCGGAIVNVVAGVSRGMPGVAHTCAARAGVVHLSKTVAVEWAPLGIRVNCVAPGVVASEGMNAYAPAVQAAFAGSNALKRFGEVEEIADAIVFLAGAGFVTGEVLTIDGGHQLWGDQWTIPRPDWFGGPA
ncbi:MAG: SDR family oxidoreductase [Polymorphobacter sp.]